MGGDLARFIGSIPVIDVHEHHMLDENPGRQIGLRQLLKESYAGWTQKPPYPLPGEPRVTLGSTSPPQASMSIWKAFGDCVVDRLCRLAGERDIPFQMHLGSALIRGSRPLAVAGRIERRPRTRFLLMHLAYPWTGELLGMAFVYRNIGST